jgi:3-hydroxymyristoyl/3-hydroxydecanoyl-(acyl carrier protein) dehydratase
MGDAHIHVPADHPAFAGHFPGHPVLPGVSLLALVQQALSRHPGLASKVRGRTGAARIDNAKFLAPVGPGTDLTVSFREQGSGVAFEVKAGDRTVARGQFAPPAA